MILLPYSSVKEISYNIFTKANGSLNFDTIIFAKSQPIQRITDILIILISTKVIQDSLIDNSYIMVKIPTNHIGPRQKNKEININRLVFIQSF